MGHVRKMSFFGDGLVLACVAGEWSLEDVQKLGWTDNVIELLVTKITNLPPETQRLLEYARYARPAC